MPVINPGDVVRITVRGHDHDNSAIQYVFYFQPDNAEPLPSQACGGDLFTRIEYIMDFLTPQISQDMHYDDITFYNMSTKEPLYEHDCITLDQGDNATYDMLPSGDAALVIADTGYSRSRPKKFIAGMHENHIIRNTINSSAMLTVLADMLVQWLTTYYDTFWDVNWVPGTWHKISETLGEFRPLVSGIVKDIVAFQRRRKPGVGA